MKSTLTTEKYQVFSSLPKDYFHRDGNLTLAIEENNSNVSIGENYNKSIVSILKYLIYSGDSFKPFKHIFIFGLSNYDYFAI